MTHKASSHHPHRARPLGSGPWGVLAAALLLATLSLAPAASADKQRSEREYTAGQSAPAAKTKSTLSPQQAVSIAKQRQQGKVLSVKRSNGTYKVKMLHQGQVRYVDVAAD